MVMVSLTSFGQTTNKNGAYYPEVKNPDWYKLIPMIDKSTPEWIKELYEDGDNFESITTLRSAYYKTHSFEKNVHTQNYKYWFRQVKDFVNDEGKVQMPAPGELFLKKEKQKSALSSTARSTTNTWTNIGPTNTYLSNGSGLKRPTQANVYCLAVAPSNTNILYAGMETGGVYKTTDKGLSWTPVTYDYAIGSIQDIKIDPNDADIVYISRGAEMYKTIDGGVTWDLIYTADDVIEQFLIHSINSDSIYAATREDLLLSVDAGANWVSKYDGYVYDIEAKPGSTDTLYISIKNDVTKRPEILRSIDAGENWTLQDNGYYSPTDLSVATVYGCKIGVTPADPDRLYAGIIATGKDGDNGWISIYYSLDNGETWQEDSGFDGAPYASGNDESTNWYVGGYASGYHQGWYNFDIDVSHTNPDKLWIGTIWFCESGNKGGNIEYIRGTRSLEMHADIQDIDVHGDDIWIASDGGINYSNDECQTVEIRMSGIIASDYWGFGQGWNEDVWVGGRYHNGDAVYHADYGDGNTVFLGGAETATGYVNPFDNFNTHYSDITDKRVTNSINAPSKNISNLGMYPSESYFDFSYSELEWHPYHSNIVFLGNENDFYKSTDGGASFSSLSTLGGELRRFEISRDDPDYIYTIVYYSHWDWRLYRSTDGGESFTELVTPAYSGGSWRNLSLTLNPFDKDEIWVASNSSSNGNKIFSSVDGGQTWTNRYSSVIEDEAIKDLIYQPASGGDVVYALTNDSFYYFDMDTDTWEPYSTGLPVLHGGFKMLPFYRDSKIRLASNKGVWEIPFIKESLPQAMPMVVADSIFCTQDTIALECFSIIDADNASWSWTIDPTPTWVNDLTIRNPKVVLGTPGSYEVELTVTDGNGNTSARTVSDMIHVSNQCAVDTIPGQALHTIENGDYAVAQNVNLTNITHFTMTGWWKPNGAQQGFAALASSGDWCAHCDYTEGLIVSYFGDKLWYKWPGNASNWGSNSGMSFPLDEWSYVALVITPTGATLYLNEQKFVHDIPLDPGDITNLYLGYGHYSKSFKGDIDEVTIWKRALSDNEVRELRHITKEDLLDSDPDLVAYYQFNTLVNGTTVMSPAGTHHAIMTGGATLESSNAPIGGGESEIFTVTDATNINSITGIELIFGSSGTYPNGDIVISKINLNPDVTPSNSPVSDSYWIINNYGTNSNFTALESITLHPLGNTVCTTVATNLKLNTRSENAFGANWTIQDTGDTFDSTSETVTFNNGLNLESSSQLIVENDGPLGEIWIGAVNTDWDNPNNWAAGIVPTSNSNVTIPAGVPYYPIVDLDVVIRTLSVEQGASLLVDTGVVFEVTAQ